VFTLKDELPSLLHGDAGAAAIAAQARLVDDLVVEAIEAGDITVAEGGFADGVVFHAHCHQKAAGATGGSEELLRRLAGDGLVVLDAGCCGMAGSFGYEREHYELSMQIGGLRLFPAVNAALPGAAICATGTSCRQQIAHGTVRRAEHPLVLVRDAVRRVARDVTLKT
jgi:Fe-S oxidoreductase